MNLNRQVLSENARPADEPGARGTSLLCAHMCMYIFVYIYGYVYIYIYQNDNENDNNNDDNMCIYIYIHTYTGTNTAPPGRRAGRTEKKT